MNREEANARRYHGPKCQTAMGTLSAWRCGTPRRIPTREKSGPPRASGLGYRADKEEHFRCHWPPSRVLSCSDHRVLGDVPDVFIKSGKEHRCLGRHQGAFAIYFCARHAQSVRDASCCNASNARTSAVLAPPTRQDCSSTPEHHRPLGSRPCRIS